MVHRTNLFVKFLPQDLGTEALFSLFSPFGTVLSAKVIVDNETGSSKGFGFVNFKTQAEAEAAIEHMNGYKIENKVLMCKFSEFSFNDPSPNIYIKPLPSDFTEDYLVALFSTYGRIESVKLVADTSHHGTEDLIGFVRYDNVASAAKAIEERNGFKTSENLPPLSVKYAETNVNKAVRRANTIPFKKARKNTPEPLEQPQDKILVTNFNYFPHSYSSTQLSPPQTVTYVQKTTTATESEWYLNPHGYNGMYNR